MSRFGNLEFGQEHSDRLQERETAKDESFYFAEATTAFEEANFEKALRSFSKVLEFNPQNAAAWTGQVRAMIELGEFREARLWADKALEHFPREPELLAAKAVALGRSGDTAGALTYSDAAISERGNTPYVWLARADVFLSREERQADWCFDQAQGLAPNSWFIAWLSARIHYFHQQFTLALKAAQRALELNSGHSVLWLMQGLCQKQVGLLTPARQSFTQALELNPRCLEAKTGLAEIDNASLGAKLSGWLKQTFRR